MAKDTGFWGRMVQNASDRMTEAAAATERYRSGERTAAEQGLMGAALAVGGVMDIPGEAISTVAGAVIPDIVKEGFRDIVAGIMDTDAAQAALQLARDNPRAAENLGRGGALALELVGARQAPKIAKEAVDSLGRNMPNELVGFYGSGAAGQVSALSQGIPSTIAKVTEEVFSPKARARVAEGISPRLRSVAKQKLKVDDSKGWSFFEGQADQSFLLGLGGGKSNPALQEIFGDIQSLGVGELDLDTLENAFSVYKPEQYGGMNLKGVPAKLLERVKTAQDVDDAIVTIRHPTALTDLFPESGGGGQASRSAKRMFKMKQLEQQYFPDKRGFSSDDEMKEFMAARFLVDDRVVRKDGGKMTIADRTKVKVTGMGTAYKYAESGTGNIVAYYKYKDMLSRGVQLKASQRKKYEKLKARVDAHKEDVKIDDEGRAYFDSTHHSSAKGLGGVRDHFVLDRQGNVLHMISDKNDLLGRKVPGDRNVITITPPARYNIFDPTNPPRDKAGAAAKVAHVEKVAEKYGVPAEGTNRDAIRRQQARAILAVDPKLKPKHFKTPMMGAVGLGIAAQAGAEE